MRFTFPTNQTFPKSRDLPKRSACGTKSTLRVSTWEGANALFVELIDSPYRYPATPDMREMVELNEGYVLDTGEFFKLI